MQVHVITLSDRASRGEYKDESGPRICEWIERYSAERDVATAVSAEILPDNPDALRAAVLSACDRGADAIITCGGTGIGPRDVTPDVIVSVADKTIPGIMEHIRHQCGAKNPLALLSRGVAAVRGQTAIYTLPGSVNAVDAYMPEILKTIDHVIGLIQGRRLH